MKTWQKVWIWFIFIVSILHSIRDLEQTVGIQNILSTTLVKPNGTHNGIWSSANTVIIEVAMLCLSAYLLKRNTFGRLGYFTIFIALSTILFFMIYWFLV